VLGGGGLAGQAYHAAVLAALEHDLGWDPRTAAVIVGTSAGAITGAYFGTGSPHLTLQDGRCKGRCRPKAASSASFSVTSSRSSLPFVWLDSSARPDCLAGRCSDACCHGRAGSGRLRPCSRSWRPGNGTCASTLPPSASSGGGAGPRTTCESAPSVKVTDSE
jgi:hypothetical protein